MDAIVVKELNKSYGSVRALKDISLNVKNNELFGLIGPDGAGKTSLLRIITTLLLPDSGRVLVNNLDVKADYKQIRRHIGYMPGRFSLYQDLSVEENLTFFATIFGTTIAENYDLVKSIYAHIEPFKKRKAGALSGGMKQKLALSCALIHRPQVLVLDEPTTGVDAVSRKEFWEMLQELKLKGISIIVSTPYMDEAGLCDRVALMQNGEIMQVDSPENIVNAFPHRLLSVHATQVYPLLQALRAADFVQSVQPFGQDVHVVGKDSENTVNQMTKYLKTHGISDFEIKEIRPVIEDCFMDLMMQ